MSKVYKITGSDLMSLLEVLHDHLQTDKGIYSLSVDPRTHGVAFKVNEDVWTFTLGVKEERS
jgi:hypothetical protein